MRPVDLVVRRSIHLAPARARTFAAASPLDYPRANTRSVSILAKVLKPAHTRRAAPAPGGPPTHGVGHGLGRQAAQGYNRSTRRCHQTLRAGLDRAQPVQNAAPPREYVGSNQSRTAR